MKEKVWLVNYTGRKGAGPLDALAMTKGLLAHNIPLVAVISSGVENLNEWKDLQLQKLVIINTYNSALELIVNTILFVFIQGRRIKKELIDYDIEVIYCPMGAFWTKKINRLFKKTQIIKVIHDPIPHSGEKPIIKLLSKKKDKRTDKIIVHSKAFVEYVQEKYHKPTYYIPLGRHNAYATCKNKRQIVQYDDKMVNFLFFGRITKYKGLGVLAEAYEQVTKETTVPVSLTIIGSGDFSQYDRLYKGLPRVTVINRWIKDEEVESAFVGDNLICICPYLDATQSGVTLLAQEYQVPVITTSTGGLEEQVLDGVTGLIVPPNDSASLASAMKRLAEDDQFRSFISRNQKKEIVKLDWSNLAEQLIEIAKQPVYEGKRIEKASSDYWK